MMQSHPQPRHPHLRVALLIAATALMTMGAVIIMPSSGTSHQAYAQSTPASQPQNDSPATTPNVTENATASETNEPSDSGSTNNDSETPAGSQADADGVPEGQAPDSDAESETSSAATGNDESMLSSFFQTPPVGYLIQGGLFMWPILLMGIIGAGVIIERYRSLNMLSGDSKQLRTDVQSLLETNQVKEAFELCNDQQGPVPAILATGLRKYLVLQTLDYEPAKIEEQVVKSMDDYSVHIVAALERHLPILATISSAAPMLGFLGTVQGMIVAFDDIVAKMGETNIVEAAAVGIKVSLMTTCFGLIVGIPAFVAFNYFTGLINRFVLDVEESATEMIEAVTLQTAISTADQAHQGESVQ